MKMKNDLQNGLDRVRKAYGIDKVASILGVPKPTVYSWGRMNPTGKPAMRYIVQLAKLDCLLSQLPLDQSIDWWLNACGLDKDDVGVKSQVAVEIDSAKGPSFDISVNIMPVIKSLAQTDLSGISLLDLGFVIGFAKQFSAPLEPKLVEAFLEQTRKELLVTKNPDAI